jgi:hypothetical protein
VWDGNLSAILIFISFTAKNVEHFFMYLLAICSSSFENYLFNLFGYILIRLFFWCLIFWGLIFSGINLLFIEWLTKSFSCSVGCLLIRKLFPLMCRSFLIWCNSICQLLLLYPKLVKSYVLRKCAIYTQWNFTQPRRRMKSYHSKVNGWNWRTSSWARLARLRRPKISLICGL